MPNQTGPTSVSGKLASCMNRLKHSACAESLFIKGENPDEFFSLLENAFEQHQPAFDQDAILVTRSVQANWIFMRRERIAAEFETALYERKPHGKYLLPNGDLHEIHLIDRYKTAAHRHFTRCLKDLQLIKKMDHDTERWQLQLAAQEEKFESDPKNAAFMAENQEPTGDESEVTQSVYAAFDESGKTIAFEASPKNDTIRRLPTPPANVVRTYHLKGPVPKPYHWLLTNDKQRNWSYQEIEKCLTFDEWQQLTNNE